MSGRKYNIAFLALVLIQAGLLLYIVAYRQHWANTGMKVIVKASPVDPRALMRGDYVRLDYDFTRMEIKASSGLIDRLRRDSTVYVTLEQEEGLYKATDILESKPSAPIQAVQFIQGRVRHVNHRKEFAFVVEDEQGNKLTITNRGFNGSLSNAIGKKHLFCMHTDTEAVAIREVESPRTFLCNERSITGIVLDARVETAGFASIDYGIDAYYVAEGTGYALERTRDKGGLDVELSLRPDGKALITAIIANGTRIE